MEQVTQKLREGRINIMEVPVPAVNPGDVLVRNLYSCISAGTESSKVSAARKSYLGKIRERPAQARQVLEKLRAQGPWQTYRDVMKKLDAHSPLGYSSAGQILDLGDEVRGLTVGDYVACGGGAACHAEIVAVPENLCVRLHPETDLKQAAYNSLGAIALQGVRQADLRLGETCAVIGLGLLGQITCLLLRSAGVRVVGIDVNPAAVATAATHCADLALPRSETGAAHRILEFTDGIGCDAVIITAATSSLDPINFAGAIARKRGTVVVVGAVPTGFDREPDFYQKELAIKMSCSYGPGRYDPDYEDKGRDYPSAYVRWTERRNMQAFQQLISARRIDLGYLTTHTFKLQDAARAYDMILEKSEPFLGVLIEYDATKEITRRRIQMTAVRPVASKPAAVTIGFIGAGSYAQGHLLPNIPKADDVVLKGVLTATPTGARSVADRFGFEFCTSQASDILGCDQINTVFIATRHDTHGGYVIDALKADKNVFVEKPLCLKEEELEEIAALMQTPRADGGSRSLMVGYNRRFSPLNETIRSVLKPGPMSMIYRVNAGAIPADSWIQDPETGGGRVLGEVCHFVDYLTHLCGALPVSVYATAIRDAAALNDTLSVALEYENGSIGNIHYFANGSRQLPKEYVEAYQAGVTVVLDDYRVVTIYGKDRKATRKLWTQDKGQQNEIALFIDSLRKGSPSPIAFDQILSTSRVCLKVLEVIRNRHISPVT